MHKGMKTRTMAKVINDATYIKALDSITLAEYAASGIPDAIKEMGRREKAKIRKQKARRAK